MCFFHSVQNDCNNFPGVEEPGDGAGSSICKPSGDDQISVRAAENTACIAGKESLAGRVQASSEQADLSAVGMAGQNEIDRMIL